MLRQIRISPDCVLGLRRWPNKAIALAGGLASILSLGAAAKPAHSADVSFSREIAPILQQKCFTCHNPEKTKGQYQLHSFATLLKPGESGEPSVTPEDPSRSQLYQLLITKDPDDRMPQKDDPLPASQIALVERWIRQGAKFDGPDLKASLASLLPKTQHPEAPLKYPRPVPILALAFSPDGRELVASGYHEVTFWNCESGELLRRVKDLPQQTQALVYSPDGSMLAAGGGTPGRSGEARLIDPKSGSILRPLGSTTDFVLALAFSPDGRRLLTGGADNVIRVFDVASGKEERRIEQHADWVVGLAFAPDGVHFASASRDKTARLYDAKTGELEETYDGHGEAVFGVSFSADSKRVFSGGRDKEIHAWQAKDAKKLYEIRGFEGEVLRLVVDGDRLFSCGTDPLVRLHQPADKKAELVRSFSGHRDVVYSVAFHEATKRIASGSFDGEVRVWDLESGALKTNFIAAPGNGR